MKNQTKGGEDTQENSIVISYQDENHPLWEIRLTDEGFSFNGEEIKDAVEIYEAYKKFFTYAIGAWEMSRTTEIKTAERELIKKILKLPTHPNGYAQERTIKPSDIKQLAKERGITIE